MPHRAYNHPKYASQNWKAHLFNQFFTLIASFNYPYSLHHIQRNTIKAESSQTRILFVHNFPHWLLNYQRWNIEKSKKLQKGTENIIEEWRNSKMPTKPVFVLFSLNIPLWGNRLFLFSLPSLRARGVIIIILIQTTIPMQIKYFSLLFKHLHFRNQNILREEDLGFFRCCLWL